MFKDSLNLGDGKLSEADANMVAARVASLMDIARKRRDSGDDLA
jgi:hypothetical protein